MSTRNRALRAIEELVHAKERAVIDLALRWDQATPGDGTDSDLAEAVAQLRDARALLAQATGEIGQGPENGAEPAPAAPRSTRTS